jgi:hypothetical protein
LSFFQPKALFAASHMKTLKKFTHEKRERYFAFSSSIRFTNKARRCRHGKKTLENLASLSLIHSFYSLIVVFAAARAEEAENAKRNAFKRNFSCFSFVLSSELFSRDFSPLNRNYIPAKKLKKRSKRLEENFTR